MSEEDLRRRGGTVLGGGQVIGALGGWHDAWQIDRMSMHDLGFKRLEFVKLYTSFSRSLPDHAPAVLLGKHEIDNRRTRGAWRPGLTHAPTVVAIGPAGEELAERPALPPAPSAVEPLVLPEVNVPALPTFLQAVHQRPVLGESIDKMLPAGTSAGVMTDAVAVETTV